MITYAQVFLDYDEIINDLRRTFKSKIHQYGTGMYDEHSEPFKYWAAYFNIRRKTLRLERLTEIALSDAPSQPTKKLIDDYKDIANYAIMAIQILEEKDDGV